MKVVTASDGYGLDDEGKLALAAFMAQAPIEYRGYVIKPVSHQGTPYYVKRRYVYCGYNVCYGQGAEHSFPGALASPGAVWFLTLGGAKTCIDVLHEVGPKPPLAPLPGVEGPCFETEHADWNDRYWDLMREREQE
jgi:hypothetical protein